MSVLQPPPPDSRCYHCNRRAALVWRIWTMPDGTLGAWLCASCWAEQRARVARWLADLDAALKD